MADIFRAVITVDCLGFGVRLNDLIKGSDHAHRRQRDIDFDRQAFSVEVINDVEGAERADVRQLRMHKVQRPRSVDDIKHSQSRRRLAFKPPLRLNAQVQRQFAEDPVDSLMVPAKALYISKIKEAQFKIPCFLFLRQRLESLRNDRILMRQFRLISVAALAYGKGRTRRAEL